MASTTACNQCVMPVLQSVDLVVVAPDCAGLCLCVAAMALWGPMFTQEQVESALAGDDPDAVSCLVFAQLQPH